MVQSKKNRGLLILAANSIGLSLDIPTRSLDALRTADLLLFEEDRPARQALKAAGIHRPYLRFTEHDEAESLAEVQDALLEGKTVCYMSDQGMPTLADPGQKLLELAYHLHQKVRIIPGPSAISATLAACPFSVDKFFYRGFLPRDKGERLLEIQSLAAKLSEPVIFLDTPYRRQQLLEALKVGFGPSCKALLAVDISGPDEDYIYDNLGILASLDLPKLNFVLVLNPNLNKKSRRSSKKR